MEELDLKELFQIFWSKRIEIILITLIFIVVGIIYSFIFVTPEYKSTTQLVLATTNDEKTNNSSAITQTELTLNSNLVSTYRLLMTSKTVLREVITNLNIKDITEEQLKNKITVSSENDTEVIEISVANENPTYACNIANEIAKVFSTQVSEIYNINNVYIVDSAEVESTPYNVNHLKDIVIFAFIGIVIAVMKVLIANMLDNTVKTEQDIEKSTGLLVLAQVPEFDSNFRKGGKR